MEEQTIDSKKIKPFQTIQTALIRSAMLTPIEWRVYCIINSFSGCSKIFPSQKTIAKKAGNLGRGTVLKSLTKLDNLGLIVKTNQHTANNKISTCEYKLIDYLSWLKNNKLKHFNPLEDIDSVADIKYISKAYITLENRFLFSEHLNANEIRLYCELLTYRYKGTINPSVSTLAEHCNVSTRTIYDTITSLEEKKLIKREGQIDENNSNATISNRYTVYNYIDWLDQIDNI